MYKDIEIDILVKQKKIYLTKTSKEPLGLNKITKVKTYINKHLTKEANNFGVFVFNGV